MEEPVTVMDTTVTALTSVLVVATPLFGTEGNVLGDVKVAVIVAVPEELPPTAVPVTGSMVMLEVLLEDQVTKEQEDKYEYYSFNCLNIY